MGSEISKEFQGQFEFSDTAYVIACMAMGYDTREHYEDMFYSAIQRGYSQARQYANHIYVECDGITWVIDTTAGRVLAVLKQG